MSSVVNLLSASIAAPAAGGSARGASTDVFARLFTAAATPEPAANADAGTEPRARLSQVLAGLGRKLAQLQGQELDADEELQTVADMGSVLATALAAFDRDSGAGLLAALSAVEPGDMTEVSETADAGTALAMFRSVLDTVGRTLRALPAEDGAGQGFVAPLAFSALPVQADAAPAAVSDGPAGGDTVRPADRAGTAGAEAPAAVTRTDVLGRVAPADASSTDIAGTVAPAARGEAETGDIDTTDIAAISEPDAAEDTAFGETAETDGADATMPSDMSVVAGGVAPVVAPVAIAAEMSPSVIAEAPANAAAVGEKTRQTVRDAVRTAPAVAAAPGGGPVASASTTAVSAVAADGTAAPVVGVAPAQGPSAVPAETAALSATASPAPATRGRGPEQGSAPAAAVAKETAVLAAAPSAVAVTGAEDAALVGWDDGLSPQSLTARADASGSGASDLLARIVAVASAPPLSPGAEMQTGNAESGARGRRLMAEDVLAALPRDSETVRSQPTAAAEKTGQNRAPDQPRFAEALAAQVRNAEVGEGHTRIELSPRGLGSIEVDVTDTQDGSLKVVVRAENSAVLTALRADRDLLSQALGGLDVGLLDLQSFSQSGADGGNAGSGAGSGAAAPSEIEAAATADSDTQPGLIGQGRLDIVT